MVNFSPLAAEIGWQFGAPQQISMDFASWLRYFRSLINSIQKAPHTLGWAAITLVIGPYSSFVVKWKVAIKSACVHVSYFLIVFNCKFDYQENFVCFEFP